MDSLPRAVVAVSPEGRIVVWNRAAERLYGWSEADVIGRPPAAFLASPETVAAEDTLLARLAGGEAHHGETVVTAKDGEDVPVLATVLPLVGDDGGARGVLSLTEDVAETRSLRQRSRDLATHLQMALGAAGMGTWHWDIASGTVEWDARLEAIYGLEPGTFPGTFEAYQELLHPDDREAVLATVEQAMETLQPYRVEHRIRWRDGTIRWVLGHGHATVGEDGGVTGAIGCSMDATDAVEARLRDEARADAERIQRQRLELIARVNDALADADTPHQVMERVTQAIVPELGDWCLMFVLPEPPSTVPEIVAAHTESTMDEAADEVAANYLWDPDAPSGMPAVIRSGQPEFLPDLSEEGVADLGVDVRAEAWRRLGLRSVVSVPLTKQGRVLGGLQMMMTESSRRYTEDDLAMAQALAGRVASAVEYRRLSQRHRSIATTLQRSLLPDTLPDIPDLEVAVRYWAAGEVTQVGGDFYDLFRLADDTWAATIGDVCGTGPEAAALTALARHTIRLAAWRGDDPATVLRWLNRAMNETRPGWFLTAAHLVLRPTDDGLDLDVACGGHPLPVVISPTAPPRRVGVPGTLLGAFDEVSIETVADRLVPGETLVLHTDGITDVAPPHFLDEAQAAALFADAAHEDVDTMADGIQDRLERILPMEQRRDDIALLLLRVP